jgi:hypothetical protein
MKYMELLRCPYCVEDDGFKILTPVGNRLVCLKCGHRESLDDPELVCFCPKCQERNRPVRGQRGA